MLTKQGHVRTRTWKNGSLPLLPPMRSSDKREKGRGGGTRETLDWWKGGGTITGWGRWCGQEDMETARPRRVDGTGWRRKILVSIEEKNYEQVIVFYHPVLPHFLFPHLKTEMSRVNYFHKFLSVMIWSWWYSIIIQIVSCKVFHLQTIYGRIKRCHATYAINGNYQHCF
jgi:hypothetical protein